MANTVTLQNVIDWSRSFTKLIPIVGVGGISNEPALSIANNVMQEILSPPYNWKWNRFSLTPFDTFYQSSTSVAQDYIYTGANASVRNVAGVGSVAIETSANSGATWNSNVATITTVSAHGFSTNQSVIISGVQATSYNGTFTIASVPTSTTFTYALSVSNPGTSGAAGISNMGWLEKCDIEGTNDTNVPKPIVSIPTVYSLEKCSVVGNPEWVCWLPEYKTDGTQYTDRIRIRFEPVPGSYQWTPYISYQQAPPIFTDITQKLTPIPDDYAYIFRQGFLAYALLHADDQRAQLEYQKFQLMINKALSRSDAENRNSQFYPQRCLMMGG